MKTLKNILSKSSNFHSLNDILKESLRIGINDSPYGASPTTWDELRHIIEDRFEKLGQGTEQEPIDFNDIDVSGMTTFIHYNTGIFQRTNFEYINISDWNVSNIKNMEYMFFGCQNLKSVGDLSNWDVSRVKNMECMFTCCENLEFVGDLSNWDVSRVKNMNGMFSNCNCLEYIGDLSKWNISNVKDMNYMFYKCYYLKSVGNLSKWDVSKVENIDRIFSYSGITKIPKWYKI